MYPSWPGGYGCQGFMYTRQSLYQLSGIPGYITTILKMKFFFPLVQYRGKQGQSSASPSGPARANQMLKQSRKMTMNMAHPPPEEDPCLVSRPYWPFCEEQLTGHPAWAF